MKLTSKLILAAVAGIALVLTVATWADVQSEREALIADAVQDHRFFVRQTRATVETVWRENGEAAALRMLRAANAEDRPFDCQIVSLVGADPSVRRPALPASELADLVRGRDVSRVARGAVYSYSPLHIEGRDGLALQLVESLADQESFLRDSTVHAVRAGVFVALACAVVIVLLGVLLVGRPVGELVRAVRRIAAGDLTRPVRITQRDEIGDLATEIDAMRERLGEAQDVAAREAAARVGALEALRHADRLRTVGQLASSLAHELGTPIQVVHGRARLLEQTGGEPAREHAKAILEQSQRMSALIRQLLDFARSVPPNRKRLDVREIATAATRMLGPITRQRGIRVLLELGVAPATASADADQLTQALTNLLMNAVQAMPDGGDVHVGVRVADVTPPAELQQASGPHVELSVRDQGSGIRKELLPRLFEPFFTTKEEGEGTGLGLSVAHGIARDHGGFIDVESEPGKGSTFRLWLPLLA